MIFLLIFLGRLKTCYTFQSRRIVRSPSSCILPNIDFIISIILHICDKIKSGTNMLIDSRESYHMAKDKDIFFSLNEYITKNIFFGEYKYLSVVGYGTVQVDNVHFNDVLFFPNISFNLLLVYQINHSGQGKTI